MCLVKYHDDQRCIIAKIDVALLLKPGILCAANNVILMNTWGRNDERLDFLRKQCATHNTCTVFTITHTSIS